MRQRIKRGCCGHYYSLSHNGYPQDIELLKKVEGIDICLSAHTHNRMYEQKKQETALSSNVAATDHCRKSKA